MCKFNKHNDGRRVDVCIKTLILNLKAFGIKTKASCCGHTKYPLSIIVKDELGYLELVSGLYIHRKRKFYKKDKQGYYYIPEVVTN